MNSQDFLNYSLAIGFLILVTFISLAFFRLAQILKDVEGTTKLVSSLGHFFKKK